MKLTPTMRRDLMAVSCGEVIDTGRIEGANPTTLRCLYQRGLVDWEWFHHTKYHLTKKGRKALEEEDE